MPTDISQLVFCPTPLVCPTTPLITINADCDCLPLTGRINDIWFIKCSAKVGTATTAPTLAQLQTPATWTAWFTAGDAIALGKGIGGFAPENTQTQDLGGCDGVGVYVNTNFKFSYKKFCADFGATTPKLIDFTNQLAAGSGAQYNVYLRLCGNTDLLVPVGKVSWTSPGLYTLPENPTDVGYFMFEFTKKFKGNIPFMNVPGLSNAIAPAK